MLFCSYQVHLHRVLVFLKINLLRSLFGEVEVDHGDAAEASEAKLFSYCLK